MDESFRNFIDDFDHHSARLVAGIPEIYAAMHQCPVVRSDRYGGYHVFTRRDDVSELAREHELFSSANDPGDGVGGGILIPPSPVRLGFMEMDPPDSLALRKVVAKWFAPGAVDGYASRMRALIRERISHVGALGEFDVVDDLANPVTAMLTLDFIGMPLDDWPVYLKPAHEQAYVSPSSPEFADVVADIGNAQNALMRLVSERRHSPADDLISLLIGSAEASGEPLTDERIVETIWVLLGGGFDTTSSAIGHILRYLSEHPERKAELTGNPGLLASAIDEFVRFFAPATFSARTVTEETVAADVRLRRGSRVLLGWAAANFDANAFENPYDVKFDREQNRHLSYGDGIHRCLGARFAQLELVIFLEEILRELPNLQVHGERAVPFPAAAVINGFIHLPASADGLRLCGPGRPGIALAIHRKSEVAARCGVMVGEVKACRESGGPRAPGRPPVRRILATVKSKEAGGHGLGGRR